MSLIARTAGIGRSAPELQWDLNYMLKLWTAIDGASKAGKGAFLIYQESSLVIRAIRDYFTADVGEILIDTDDIFDQAQQFMAHVMPETAHKVKRYRDDAPLFSRFQIEHQIETAFSRTVNLPSGGAIVIDHTEALVSVDVNSARSTRGSDIEETATRTNLEAADEIARQMRLRDLGGLIVVDFIDMEESKNRREVETRLRDALRQDRARVQFSSISKFGLLELSRQRLRPALSEGSHITCPRCNGTGHIRDTESSALQILRMVQEESMKDNTAAVHVQVPVEVTSFLLNEKRTEITKIELKQRVTVLLVPNKTLETPNYRLERLRHDDPRLENLQASYTMIDEPEEEVGITRREKAKAKQEPVIKGILPETPAPVAVPKAEPIVVAAPQPAPVAAAPAAAGGGFFRWVKSLFGAEPEPAVSAPAVAPAVVTPKAGDARDGRGDRGERGGRGGRGGRDGKRGEGRGEGRGERGEGRGERGDRGERGEGRGRRPERAERPTGDEAVRSENLDAARSDERAPRPPRDDNRGEGRRGPRPEREPRRAAPPGEVDSGEAVAQEAFVDTQPIAGDAPEGGETQGERQGGRRRNRRGGRGGRERDEATAGADTGAMGAGADETPERSSADLGTVEGPAEAMPDTARAEAGEGGEGRRRGRGRDRNRRERGAEPVADAGAEPSALIQSDALASEAFHDAEAAAQPAMHAMTEVSAPAFEPAPVAPVAMVTPTPVETEPQAAPAAIDAAPVGAAQSAPAPAVAAFVLPLDSLQAVAESAGLQWVNSDAEKIRAVRAAMAAEPPPVHVPRERRAVPVVDEGPLVLVETRKDLSQVRLPFETAPGSQPQA